MFGPKEMVDKVMGLITDPKRRWRPIRLPSRLPR
jgi:hypothetical protein